MYLKNFHIKDFRCISDLDIEFQKGLNVLIGENNSGKTAVIDALRLALGIGSNHREIYIDSDDFHIRPDGAKTDQIEYDLIFSEPTIEEQGVFFELLVIKENVAELQLHIRYKLENRNGIERIKFVYWGGENEGQSIVSEVFEFFYYVHLGALRNAEKDLSPSRGNRTSQLFLKLLEDINDQKKYAQDIQDKIDELENWKELKKKAKNKVNEHLSKLTIVDSKQEIDINYIPFEYKKIVENLKMQLLQRFGNDSVQQFEIYQNGLGYNNLIYISTVLGDIFERKQREKESFISLFIEEPEAHLHPQLQDILFNFLKKTAEEKIQIFITSHSPTVSAKSQLNSIIVLQKTDDNVSSVSLKECNLNEPNQKKLERFLDVTKAQLFFAKGVLLVEGISEALLIPTFSEILGYDLDQSGIEIVNINGVAFEPFAKLFNSINEKERLKSRCSIVTDDDCQNGSISKRAGNAVSLKNANLNVLLSKKTFEYELFITGNEEILKNLYLEMHPRTIIATADDFIEKLENNKDKAEFAQNLAYKLNSDQETKLNFRVPKYIKDSLAWVLKKENA